jgi:predicted kinase
MTKPTLYLLVGYPGAGKTTTSKFIEAQTGAVHLWADHERRKRYGIPTHTHQENLQLYSELNQLTAKLLKQGKSVIFDTNFNFYKDREKLRTIAAEHHAKTIVVWIVTHKDIARVRATQDAHMQHTRILGNMPLHHFERISNNLEPPHPDEHAVQLDGAEITAEAVAQALNQA